jgi:chromosomal replication initiation ATPase DnaA
MTIGIPVAAVMAIIKESAHEHRCGVAEVLSDSRVRHIVRARQWAMWRVREELKMSWHQIGREFSRDHSTAIHAIQVVQSIIDGRKKHDAKATEASQRYAGPDNVKL